MTATLEQIELEFAPLSLYSGGILILAPDEAIRFIERARREGYPVRGLDGFRIGAEFIQPSMEHSIDYSSKGDECEGAWSEAIEFVRAAGAHVTGFEVVLGADRIPESPA